MRTRLATLAVVATAIAIAGCGGASGNGVASKSPSAILSAVEAAVKNLHSVHVDGSVVSGTTPVTLDLDLVAGKGGSGSISIAGLSCRIVAAGRFLYMNGGKGFWTHFSNSSVASLVAGKWLKVPTSSASFGSLGSLVNLPSLLSGLLKKQSGQLARGGTKTVDGQSVVALNDTSQGGTLYVATTGQPYPIEIVKGGASGGRLTFTKFNAAPAPTVPANALDISKLQG